MIMPLETKTCPKCNKVGQRKYYMVKDSHSVYERFDHYGHEEYTSHHLHYKSSCYIGKVSESKIITINPINSESWFDLDPSEILGRLMIII